MGRRDDRAREACEAVMADDLATRAAAAFPVPRIHGTTVKSCLDMGEGAAIVHGAAGVLVVDFIDEEDPDTVVLADFAELAQLVLVEGKRAVEVARALMAREARAFNLFRSAVAA